MKRILVAGIGNIFLGDDAFGCGVVQMLARRELPEAVRVLDFGIRSYDLAYALTEGYDVVILVDATPRGEPPGTLFLIEPDLAQLGSLESAPLDGHSLDPVRVLQLAESLGGPLPAQLYLVGCEPAGLGGEEGQLGLSAPVQAALPQALERIERLIRDLIATATQTKAGPVPV